MHWHRRFSHDELAPPRWYHAPIHWIVMPLCGKGQKSARKCGLHSPQILPFPLCYSPDNSTIHVRKIFGQATIPKGDSSNAWAVGLPQDANEFARGATTGRSELQPIEAKSPGRPPVRLAEIRFARLYTLQHPTTLSGASGDRVRLSLNSNRE